MEIPLEYLLRGFINAYTRTKDAKNQIEPKELFTCLFETLNWVVAIDDRLKRDRNDNIWYTQYRADGDVLRAVRFARNRVHHQWADIVYNTPGAVLPMELPAGLHEWNSKRLQDLPPALPRFSDPSGEGFTNNYSKPNQ
ncbi:MAG: hypothetical protein ACR2LN_07245 [Candidatus Levyibacteriota bacterium]